MSKALSLPDYTDIAYSDKASDVSRLNNAWSEPEEFLSYGSEKYYGLYRNMCYVGGNTYYFGAFYGGGYITGSSETLRFDIPLGHIPVATSVRVTGEIKARQNGNYVLGSSSTTASLDYTATLSSNANWITVEKSVSSAINNAACSVQLEGINLAFTGGSPMTDIAFTRVNSNSEVDHQTFNDNFALFSKRANELYDAFLYKPQDTVTLPALHQMGYITAGYTEVHFTVPLAHPVCASNVVLRQYSGSTVYSTPPSFRIRSNGTYIQGTDGGSHEVPDSASATLSGSGDGVSVTLTIDPTDSQKSGALNNEACGVESSSIALVFS